tara:strand:+ start:33016 stop:33648 length:633 start_codon:yes stop_codon:yes gene_type:complete
MRSGDPGWEISANGDGDSWAAGGAIAGGWVKGLGMTWGTPFSLFRFAIPELMNFEGRAIYLDADMLLLDDIAKLDALHPSPSFGYRCINAQRTDVSVIDCAWFKDKEWWPSLAKMKSVRARVFEYMRLMQHHDALDVTLPRIWNDVDGKHYKGHPGEVGLLHYSHVMVGQPWCPYDNVDYPKEWPHVKTCVSAAERWFREKDEMEVARAR